MKKLKQNSDKMEKVHTDFEKEKKKASGPQQVNKKVISFTSKKIKPRSWRNIQMIKPTKTKNFIEI